MNLDTKDLNVAWEMFFEQASKTQKYDEEKLELVRRVFFSGGAMCIAVLSNRLSELPGTVEPSEMIKALIDTIAESMKELQVLSGADEMPPAGHG